MVHSIWYLAYGIYMYILLEIQGNYNQARSVAIINHLQAPEVEFARLYLGYHLVTTTLGPSSRYTMKHCCC